MPLQLSLVVVPIMWLDHNLLIVSNLDFSQGAFQKEVWTAKIRLYSRACMLKMSFKTSFKIMLENLDILYTLSRSFILFACEITTQCMGIIFLTILRHYHFSMIILTHFFGCYMIERVGLLTYIVTMTDGLHCTSQIRHFSCITHTVSCYFVLKMFSCLHKNYFPLLHKRI